MVRRNCEECGDLRNCLRTYEHGEFVGWYCADCYEEHEQPDSPYKSYENL